jgi:hypothetical protein
MLHLGHTVLQQQSYLPESALLSMAHTSIFYKRKEQTAHTKFHRNEFGAWCGPAQPKQKRKGMCQLLKQSTNTNCGMFTTKQ